MWQTTIRFVRLLKCHLNIIPIMSLKSYLVPWKMLLSSHFSLFTIQTLIIHSLTLLKPFKCNAMDNLRQISFINIMPRSLARRRCAIALWELVSHFFCCLFALTLLSSYMTLILMRIKNINIFIKAEKYRRKMTMKKKSEMTF